MWNVEKGLPFENGTGTGSPNVTRKPHGVRVRALVKLSYKVVKGIPAYSSLPSLGINSLQGGRNEQKVVDRESS